MFRKLLCAKRDGIVGELRDLVQYHFIMYKILKRKGKKKIKIYYVQNTEINNEYLKNGFGHMIMHPILYQGPYDNLT